MKLKLLQVISAKALNNFLISIGESALDKQTIIPLNSGPLVGDFVVAGGYKFKQVYSKYQVMEMPGIKYKTPKVAFYKAQNDYYKKT